jgi:hypothetical protein
VAPTCRRRHTGEAQNTLSGVFAGTVRLENKLHSVLGELASCKSSLAHERGDNMRLREASVMKVRGAAPRPAVATP